MKLNINYLLFYLGIIQMLLAYFLFSNFNIYIQYINLILFWFLCVIFAYKGKQNTIPLFFFLLTFFIFLLGKDFFEILFGYANELFSKFSKKIYSHIYYCLHLSLFSIFLGAYFFKKEIKVVYLACSQSKVELLRKVSKKIIYFTLLFKIVTVLIGAYNMIKYSYVNLEADNLSSFYIVDRLAQINYLSIIVYLITYPSKNETIAILKWVLPVYVLSILGGARGPSMYFLLFIFSYLLFRDYCNKKSGNLKEVFITKSVRLFMLISFVPLIIFLTAYASIRVHETYESDGQGAVAFFLQQGGSYSLIGYAKQYEDILPETNISYTMGPLLGIIEPILHSDLKEMDKLTYDAFYGNNLGATITCLDFPAYYYMGGGYGTQYIAELYADFGYWGVFIFSFLLGILLVRISFFSSSSWLKNSLFAACILSLYKIPRDYYFSWLIMIFSFWNILFLFLLNTYLKYKSKKN